LPSILIASANGDRKQRHDFYGLAGCSGSCGAVIVDAFAERTAAEKQVEVKKQYTYRIERYFAVSWLESIAVALPFLRSERHSAIIDVVADCTAPHD